MPDDEHELWQYAASNRARIEYLEHELGLVRTSMHQVRAEVAAVRFLAEQVKDLATNVDALAGQVATVSRRAVERPSATTLAVLAQYLSLAVALIALIVALSR